MARLGFLAHGLAQGLVGAQRGRDEAEEKTYARNTRKADMEERRQRSRALAEYNASIAESRRIEAEARRAQAAKQEGKDELDAEQQRLNIKRLQAQEKNGWRNEPGQREQMMREAMQFRDQKVREGMALPEANRLMKQQYPLLGGLTMEDLLQTMLHPPTPGTTPPAP